MRLFVGLELSHEASETLAAVAEQLETLVDSRFVPMERYHLTLAFLGEHPERELSALHDALSALSDRFSPISLRFSALGCFGRRKSGILYAGVEPNESLKRLAQAVRHSLQSSGFSVDPTPFTPHVTLSRKCAPTDACLRYPLPSAEWTAERFTLFHSSRVCDALQYLPLQRFPLHQKG